MYNIVRWELWQRRWSIMWWTIGIVAFIALNLLFYPSFRDQSQQLEQAFSDIPDSAMALLSDTGDFMSPVGYLSSQIFYLMLPMLLGILAISLGSSLLGKEEKEGTIELLLSRPISRTQLLFSKALAGISITLLVGLIAALVTSVLAKLVKLEASTTGIVLATVVCWMMAVSFGAVAFVISSLGKARIASVGIATLYALGGYIIASLINVAEWLRWPAKAFPFNYYHPAIIMQSNYNWANSGFFVAVIVLAGIIAWLVFNRRDITS